MGDCGGMNGEMVISWDLIGFYSDSVLLLVYWELMGFRQQELLFRQSYWDFGVISWDIHVMGYMEETMSFVIYI